MTARQYTHGIGVSNPQNAAECVKFTLPSQAIELGLLNEDEAVVFQIDQEVGLPVISTADNFGEMYGTYGEPDVRQVRGRTTTVPKDYTKYAYKGGHPQVNFTREDLLGFFAPESKIANNFSRLYVGTFEDYQRISEECSCIVWGEAYQRSTFVSGRQKRVREICILSQGKDPVRTTRPVNEGWVRAEKLMHHNQRPDPSAPPRSIADDD